MKINRILFLTLLLAGLLGLSACKDDDLIVTPDSEDEQIFDDGPSISFTITIDELGGVVGGGMLPSIGPKTVRDVENYIDPQKCRILFFDSNDKFIFESKSRYVKKRSSTSGDYSEWTVTVPFYDYGNDRDENWPWKQIKAKLMSEPFKIAILANHPEREYNMGIVGRAYDADGSTNSKNYETDEVVPNTWFRNDGPNWDKTNSVCGGTDVKDVFDLHHCQTDMVYKGKNYDQYHPYDSYTESTVNGVLTGTAKTNHSHENLGFYNKISTYLTADETATGNTDANCQMGPVVSWVDFGENDDKKHTGYDIRYARMPSFEYPIPMYGIQSYGAIPADKWIDGSTYRLEGKPISMLRSCVKLEILVPVTFDIDQIALIYSNIYSRCEPNNIWDPTDEVWDRNHANPANCEWKRVFDFGLMTEKTNCSSKSDSREKYWKKLGWIYANWRNSSKGWHYGFGNTEQGYKQGNDFVEDAIKNKPEPPEIFNPCVQRNNYVLVDPAKHVFDDISGYHHIIVYTGERSPNDPTNLSNIGGTSAGDPTLFWWEIWVKKKGASQGQKLSIPIIDYDKNSAGDIVLSEDYTSVSAPDRSMGVVNKENRTGYMQKVQDGTGVPIPLPFLRNHVYRLTLTGKTANSNPDNWDRNQYPKDEETTFNVRYEHLYSRSIGRAVMGGNIPTDVETLQPNLDTYTPSK